jgi:hypothetical protein
LAIHFLKKLLALNPFFAYPNYETSYNKGFVGIQFQNMGLMLKEGKDYELPKPVVFTETIAKAYGPGAENLAHRGFEKNLVFLSLFAWRKAQGNC